MRDSLGNRVSATKILWRCLFELVKWLPASCSPLPGLGPMARRIRYVVGSRVVERCGRNVNFERGSTFGSRVSIGDGSGIGRSCILKGPVTIGAYVNMAPHVLIHTQNHRSDRLDVPMQDQGNASVRPVVIGDDVWIGERAILLPGVRIGRGAIVGAGAVVPRDVPPFAVAVGNPARVVKLRGSEEERIRLLGSETAFPRDAEADK